MCHGAEPNSRQRTEGQDSCSRTRNGRAGGGPVSRLSKQFTGTLQKSPNKGGWTFVVMANERRFEDHVERGELTNSTSPRTPAWDARPTRLIGVLRLRKLAVVRREHFGAPCQDVERRPRRGNALVLLDLFKGTYTTDASATSPA